MQLLRPGSVCLFRCKPIDQAWHRFIALAIIGARPEFIDHAEQLNMVSLICSMVLFQCML